MRSVVGGTDGCGGAAGREISGAAPGAGFDCAGGTRIAGAAAGDVGRTMPPGIADRTRTASLCSPVSRERMKSARGGTRPPFASIARCCNANAGGAAGGARRTTTSRSICDGAGRRTFTALPAPMTLLRPGAMLGTAEVTGALASSDSLPRTRCRDTGCALTKVCCDTVVIALGVRRLPH